MFQESYARQYDLLNKAKRYDLEIPFVYDWARQPRRVLDLGCGTASYWNLFPRNVQINGLEKSKAMRDLSLYKKSIILGDICKMNFDMLYGYDLVTMLFNVINYLPDLAWLDLLPVKKGGYFIFDAYDYEKVKKSGFSETKRQIGNLIRTIKPTKVNSKKVRLDIQVENPDCDLMHEESHDQYLWSDKDIEKSSQRSFDIVETKTTDTWQKWYKLRKK